MKLDVSQIVGKTAVSREGGLKLKDAIEGALVANKRICLDFAQIQVYASPFFNTSVAPYLGKMTFQELKERVSFENLSPVGKSLLNQVIHNAIDFYSKGSEEQDELEDKVSKGLE
jgi:hypothetical protein